MPLPGLKKVTSDMQTHKNPDLRSGPAPIKAADGPKPAVGSVAAPVADKPPKFTRDGKKWLIVSSHKDIASLKFYIICNCVFVDIGLMLKYCPLLFVGIPERKQKSCSGWRRNEQRCLHV